MSHMSRLWEMVSFPFISLTTPLFLDPIMLLFSFTRLITYIHIFKKKISSSPVMSCSIYTGNENIIISCGALLMCHILLLSWLLNTAFLCCFCAANELCFNNVYSLRIKILSFIFFRTERMLAELTLFQYYRLWICLISQQKFFRYK